MIAVLIHLLIIFLILGVAWWIVDLIPLPAPFHTVAHVIIALIALLLLINLLLGVAPLGHGISSW